MAYRVSFTDESGSQKLIMEPGDNPLTIDETDLWEITSDPYREYTEDELLVIQQLLEEHPNAKDIDICDASAPVKKSREKGSSSSSSGGNTSVLGILGAILSAFAAPIIIGLGMFGIGLLKGNYDEAREINKFKSFRMAFILITSQYMAFSIFTAIYSLITNVMNGFVISLAVLFVSNIAFYIISNKVTKKIVENNRKDLDFIMDEEDYQIKKNKLKKSNTGYMVFFAFEVIMTAYASFYEIFLLSRPDYPLSFGFFAVLILLMLLFMATVVSNVLVKDDFWFHYLSGSVFSLLFLYYVPSYLSSIRFRGFIEVFGPLLTAILTAASLIGIYIGLAIFRNRKVALQFQVDDYEQPKEEVEPDDELNMSDDEYIFNEEEAIAYNDEKNK